VVALAASTLDFALIWHSHRSRRRARDKCAARRIAPLRPATRQDRKSETGVSPPASYRNSSADIAAGCSAGAARALLLVRGKACGSPRLAWVERLKATRLPRRAFSRRHGRTVEGRAARSVTTLVRGLVRRHSAFKDEPRSHAEPALRRHLR
jgi:hypothetical protein